MGFFDDTSILDMTMDSLLSSFRQEIANDLSAQDEIIFQVDELGLEYTEVCLSLVCNGLWIYTNLRP